MMERSFWRGFFPLLASFGAASMAPQVDIAMLAKLHASAPAAFVLLARVALFEFVLMTATGVVAAIHVAEAQKTGSPSRIIRQVWTLALLIGAGAGVLGFLSYPFLAQALVGNGQIGVFAGAAIPWFVAGAPIRFLASVGSFSLHAVGRGAWVLRWAVCEIGLKAAGNYLFMDILGYGFKGCFMSALAVASISASFYYWQLRRHGLAALLLPDRLFALKFLRSTGWETQRLLLPQLAIATALALFALPWFGQSEFPRLEAYAAGQILIMFILTPLIALARFLSLRLAGRPAGEIASLVRTLWLQGTPFVTMAAIALFAEGDWLGGAVYGQRGPWWSALVTALAISLPLRYIANVMRGALQGMGCFAETAGADGLAPWLVGLPLIATGLYIDNPSVAYLALIAPETVCAVWLWRRLRSSFQIKSECPR